MFRLALITALAVGGLSAAVANTEPPEVLIDSARLWESRDRPDLARLALEKVLRAQPGHPEASLQLADLELRSGEIEAARQRLNLLEARHPEHPAVRQLRAAIRLYTDDRLAFATMRRLREIGDADSAAVQARLLFPDGPPPGPLALEYWTTLGATDAAFDEARRGLEDLQRQYPDDLRYPLALARLEITRVETRAQGLQRYARLAGHPEADRDEVLGAWKTALDYLGEHGGARPWLRAYLAEAPGDPEVASRLQRLNRLGSSGGAPPANDPFSRALRAIEGQIERGALTEAESALAALRVPAARQGDHQGTLGVLRLRQGRHAEAENLFERARRQPALQGDRWAGLWLEARYAVALEDIDGLLARGALDEAEARLRQAQALRPGRNETALRQAQLWARQPGRQTEAEAGFRRLLDADPGSLAAGRGLVELLDAQGRGIESDRLLTALAERAPAAASNWNALRSQRLREQAERALARGQAGTALAALETAVTLAPRDPWARHALARRYLALGLPQEAETLMAEGRALAPEVVDMRYAQALILNSLGQTAAASETLAGIPTAEHSEGITALAQQLQLQLALQEVRALQAAGNTAGARAQLLAAETGAAGDPNRRADLALAWIDLGNPDRARALMAAAPAAADDVPALLAEARVLEQLEDHAGLEPRLSQLRRLSLDEGQQGQLAFLARRQAIAELRRLRADGEAATALAQLRSDPRIAEPDRETLELEVALLIDADRSAEATALVETALAAAPNQADLLLMRAETLRASGEVAAARAALESLLQQLPADDAPRRGAGTSAQGQPFAHYRAAAVSEELATAAPAAPETAVAQARVALAQGRGNQAMAYFQSARAAERARGDRGWSPAQFGIDSLEASRDGFITAGMSYLDRSGDAGISQFQARQIPIELRVPYGYEGHFFAITDLIDADAGLLPGDEATAARFGSVQAGGPDSLAAVPDGVRQDAQGVDLGLGWQSERLRVDLGTTPIGFLVRNTVGGLRWDDRIGSVGYGLNLSRRPVGGSLLSYAGVRDPVSGRVWGGVVRTGLDGRLSRDFGRLGSSLSLGAHRLTGENVPDNEQFTLRAALDWPLLRQDHQRLNTGLALSAWHYAENLGEYSFGHGGYYSPQQYLSLALPVEWSGRWQRLAWRASGSLAYSQTQTDAQVFHPNDPALQAAAEAQAANPLFGDAVYGGGRGGGSSYSLRGALEYRMSPHWFIGSNVEIDRSEFYTPNFFNLYLRYDFDGQPDRIRFPPRPPLPYLSY
jgi:cellulose synthase operon protein C